MLIGSVLVVIKTVDVDMWRKDRIIVASNATRT